MNRGQGAIMDALFFMFICAVASTLLFYVSGLYGQGIDQQISAIYNLEYTGNSLVALQSHENYHFWYDIRREVLDGGNQDNVENLLDPVWPTVKNSSPSQYPFLCFEGGRCELEKCYPFDGYEIEENGFTTKKEESDFFGEGYVAYTSSVVMETGCEAVFKVYY